MRTIFGTLAVLMTSIQTLWSALNVHVGSCAHIQGHWFLSRQVWTGRSLEVSLRVYGENLKLLCL